MFIHLHGHSQYSALDGACKIDALVNKAMELGQNAIALTEHGNIASAFEFYHACQGKIKPILGCEFYFAADGVENKGTNTHLVLLCKDYEG